MKKLFSKSLLAALALAGSSSLSPALAAPADASEPSVIWEILPPDSLATRPVMRFTVQGLDSISRLCFTQLPRPWKAITPGDSLVEINAGYYSVTSPLFGTSAPEAVIDIRCRLPLRAAAEGPGSFHAITPSGRAIPVRMEAPEPMSDAALRDARWQKWMIPADSIFRLNERLATGKVPGPFDIAPSFKKVTLTEGTFTAGLPVRTQIIDDPRPEFYRITLTPDSALIEAVTPAAVAMGRRMLERRLLEPAGGSLPCAVIEDWPDFPNRA